MTPKRSISLAVVDSVAENPMKSATEFSQRCFMFLRIATGWIDQFCLRGGIKVLWIWRCGQVLPWRLGVCADAKKFPAKVVQASQGLFPSSIQLQLAKGSIK